MRRAKDMGPARSPTVLLTPRPLSAKVEAHWLTACSLAPALSIIRKRIQKIFMEKSCFMVSPVSPSSMMGAMGVRAKTRVLRIGTMAQIRASSFQLEIPASLKKMVEISTTPIWPQQ